MKIIKRELSEKGKMAKRGADVRGDSPAEDSDLMKITPLGSGQEVNCCMIFVVVTCPR